MSLRTTFTGALDTKLAEARDAGSDSVLITNLTAITTTITAAANSGKKKFTVNIPVVFQPADLRALGLLWFAYQTGVIQALASEDIMVNEAQVALNSSDQLATSVDLKFSF